MQILLDKVAARRAKQARVEKHLALRKAREVMWALKANILYQRNSKAKAALAETHYLSQRNKIAFGAL